MAAIDVVDAYLAELPGDTRRLADGEWGVTVAPESAGGWPLDIGMRLAEGLLRVQAYVLPADERYDPWGFLFVNRRTRMVRYGCTGDGDIWIHADVPATAIDARLLDRLLGLVVEAAVVARDYAVSARGERAEEGSSWLGGAGGDGGAADGAAG